MLVAGQQMENMILSAPAIMGREGALYPQPPDVISSSEDSAWFINATLCMLYFLFGGFCVLAYILMLLWALVSLFFVVVFMLIHWACICYLRYSWCCNSTCSDLRTRHVWIHACLSPPLIITIVLAFLVWYIVIRLSPCNSSIHIIPLELFTFKEALHSNWPGVKLLTFLLLLGGVQWHVKRSKLKHEQEMRRDSIWPMFPFKIEVFFHLCISVYEIVSSFPQVP